VSTAAVHTDRAAYMHTRIHVHTRTFCGTAKKEKAMSVVCEVCDKTLANKHSLSAHLRRQHSDVAVREHILAMKVWLASPESKAWIESGRPCPVPRRQGTRDVVRRLITTPQTTDPGTDSEVCDAAE